MKALCVILFLAPDLISLEGFQWSFKQQATDVMDVAVGLDITLPCEYVLSPQEQQEANTFHLLTWTREEPMNSNNWTGLAVKSTLTGSKVIYDDTQRISFTDGTLTLKNVNAKDHTRYQCAFQSGFFTTPSTIQLNVQYKPTETQMTTPSSEVKEGEPFQITCTARANPSPEYKFYRGNKLIRWTSTGLLSFASVKSEDAGTYRCVPNNKIGDGPEATVTFTVKVAGDPFPVWAYYVVGGGVLFLIFTTAVIAVCCARKDKKKSDKRRKKSQQQGKTLRPRDARESHVGPGAFYMDNMNGGTEIPHLNGALSFSDVRMSREISQVNGALNSLNDVRTGQEIPAVQSSFSADDVRRGEISAMKSSFSVDDVRLGETMQGAYPSRSVIQLIDGGSQHDSQL